MKKLYKILIVEVLMILACNIYGQEKTRILDLRGEWKFTISKTENWNTSWFDDHNWEKIKVPSPWESQGFYGYDGYAFYRKNINIPSVYKNHMIYLKLGYIDDVDEVYFNGELVGSTGSFPPKLKSAYNAKREYYIPGSLIHFDQKNVIAVKVYDAQQEGGIVSGEVGIYIVNNPVIFDIDLQGKWKFKTGDNMVYKEKDYNDNNWNEIIVPSNWEDMGYRDYDGYAWYRITFKVTKNIPSDRLVLMLGKIDDIDEAYLNGKFIGRTGYFTENSTHANTWKDIRGYYFLKDQLDLKGNNTIAVRVRDYGAGGGIYQGPVGIATQEKYIEYWRRKKEEKF